MSVLAKIKLMLSKLESIIFVGFHERRALEGQQSAEGPLHRNDPMDLGSLRERLRDYLVTHYMGLHVTIVSVALAIAGLSAAGLVSQHQITGSDLWLLWLLWAGGLLATMVAYAGMMVGVFALPPAVPHPEDLFLPLLMGVSEFVLFAVLLPPLSVPDLGRMLDAWLAAMAGFTGVALWSIVRVARHFGYRHLLDESEKDYTDEARQIIERYVQYLYRDAIGAGTGFVVSLTGFIVRVTDVTEIALLFPILIVVLLVTGVFGHGQTSIMWRLRLSQATARSAEPINRQTLRSDGHSNEVLADGPVPARPEGREEDEEAAATGGSTTPALADSMQENSKAATGA